MSASAALVWFRRDLRLADNPALYAASRKHRIVFPVYIHAPEEEGTWPPGQASRWWLHESLKQLDQSLAKRGAKLILRQGPSAETLLQLCQETGADIVYWNRLPEPFLRRRDLALAATLKHAGIKVSIHNGTLLFDPELIRSRNGAPFQRFTPFWRTCLSLGLAVNTLPAPKEFPPVSPEIASSSVDELQILPKTDRYLGFAQVWQPGEEGALRQLEAFCATHLRDYAALRDRPDVPGTSRLSPHLHFGEISPRQVAASVLAASDGNGEAFLRELIWREFSHYLLYHFPELPEEPQKLRFATFPWKTDETALATWQRGMTGIPLVDAGMRQLRQTGWMHNRVRMVVASFLVKHLLIRWQEGERWFWDTLVDADLANNSQNWQWVASCGADAAPYFRIFNPVLQGRKFDPHGCYVRRWVPELARLSDKVIHAPWEAKSDELRRAGVKLGKNYPRPIVDLKASHSRALRIFEKWREVRG